MRMRSLPILFLALWCSTIHAFLVQVAHTGVSKHATLASNLQATETTNEDSSTGWMWHGLLLSSFSDGLKPNPEARNFLMQGLVECLWKEQQALAESKVAESVIQSPCCGPDLEALAHMESADSALLDLSEKRDTWKSLLQELLESCDDNVETPLDLRFLYIPTAMYALRSDSTNSPGKQRQRARADGKKRRTEISRLLSDDLGDSVNVLTVTLDLDDGSLKQPEGSSDQTKFPQTATAALKEWNPHFIYVQGGNTFWLHHCMKKGGWEPFLREACTGDNAAVFCGTSAGAIIMGECMETACWKEWDDPSVVPDQPNYSDWDGVPGLQLAGGTSFFPHMDSQWEDMVAVKKKLIQERSEVVCLHDEDACFVEGVKQRVTVVSGHRATVQT